MAQTIKVLGSGPLVGKVFYGTLYATGERSPFVWLELDEPAHDGFNIQRFDRASGGLHNADAGSVSDLLVVDPTDLPRVDEMVTLALV